MTHAERRPEQRHYAGYASDLRERFQSGLLSELLPYSQFVVWKYTMEQGKLKKRPYNPRTNLPAKTTDPSTWTNVSTALKALATGRYNGIGFVFAESDPFTGTDLDNCVSKDGSIAAWAQEIITTLDTYTEYSPSKFGVHLLTQATLEGAGRKIGTIEMYSQGRFFTLTADHVTGTPTAIEDRQQQQTSLYTSLVPEVPPTRSIQNTGGVVGTARLSELPPDAARDPVLQELLSGNMTRYGNDHHRADWHLLMKLLHWTGDDRQLSKNIFLNSPLGQRAKAQEPEGEGRRGNTNYVDRTIDRIIEKRRNPPMR